MKTSRIRRVMAVFMCIFTLMTMLPANHAHAGTCYECGGETYPITTFQPNYVYLGNNTHNIIMEEWVYNHCHACEMSYSGMPTGVITETIGNCDIEMGRCTVCGNTFDGPCAHENAIYSDCMAEGATYVYYDADSHYGVGTYISDKICNDCGEILESHSYEVDGAMPHLFSHIYDNGTCVDCGNYIGMDVCQHTNYRIEEFPGSGTVYIPSSATHHIVDGMLNIMYICNDCGEIFDNTGDMGLERPHEFNNGVCSRCYYVCGHESIDADGYCTNCGIQRGNIEPTGTCHNCYGPTYPVNVTQDNYVCLGDGTHNHIEENWVYNHCSACDLNWSGYPEYIIFEQNESCLYDNGTCTGCGHVTESAAPTGTCHNCYGPTYPVNVTQDNYVYLGNNTHNHIVENWSYNHCYSCDLNWSGMPNGIVNEFYQNCYYENGVCVSCGHVDEYAVPTGTCHNCYGPTYPVNVTQDNYVCLGDGTHNHIEENWVYNHCSACDLNWSGYPEYIIFEQNESCSYDNGTCTGCGHVTESAAPTGTCHNCYGPTYPVNVTQDNYVYLGNNTHNHIVENWTYNHCYSCDLNWSGVPNGIVNETYKGCSLENGICTGCGNIFSGCSHGFTYESSEYSFEYAPISGSDAVAINYHVVYEYRKTDIVCSYCGITVETGDKEMVNEFTQGHWYNNGVCDSCGISNPCAHPEALVYSYESFGYYTGFESIDDVNHYAFGPYYNVTKCSLCNEQLSWVFLDENASVVMPHNYDSEGRCWDCGHQNSCAHPEDSRSEYRKYLGEYAMDSRTADEHTLSVRSYTKGVRCDLCGMDMGPEYEEYVSYDNWIVITEAHVFNETNHCMSCDYIAGTCPHSNVSSNYEFIPDFPVAFDHEKTDFRYHYILGYDRYNEYCNDCGNNFDGGYYHTNQGEAHTYEGNTCTVCGFVNTCDHVYTNEYRRYVDVTYIFNENDPNCNNIYHEERATIEYITECSDCGFVLDSYIAEEPEVFWSGHDYIDGVCSQCGHVNTCVHPESCIYSYYANTDSVFYSYNDKLTHTATSDMRVERFVCDLCQDVMYENVIGENYSFTEPHRFDEYVGANWCMDCCTYIECDHAAGSFTEKITRFYDSYCSERTEQTHTYELTQYDVSTFCDECGICVNEETRYEPIEFTEPHRFDNWGQCTACGLRNGVCPHNDREYIGNFEPNGEYEQYDEYNHIAYGVLTEASYCRDCETQISANVYPNYSEYQSHTYENGVCVCGRENACGHSWTYEDSRYVNQSYVSLDFTTHRVTAYREYRTYCYDCSSYIDSYISEEPEVWDQIHEYKDGQCALCGNVNTCEHPEANVARWGSFASWNSCDYIDTLTHTRRGEYYNYAKCMICHEMLSAELVSSDYAVTEKHEYESPDFNMCIYCGVFIECEHPEDMRSEHVRRVGSFNVNYRNEEEHSITALSYELSICCDACGMVLSSEWRNDERAITGPHEYTDYGQCLLCSKFKDACAHDSIESANDRIAEEWHYAYPDAHHAYGKCVETTFCPDCGLETYRNEYESDWYEDHTFVNGVCVCGHTEDGCQHPTFKTTYLWGEYEEHPYDRLFHVRTGEYIERSVCSTCGIVVSEVVIDTNYSHNFAHKINSKGVCRLCGYERDAACSHPDSALSYTVSFSGEAWTPIDENNHEYSVKRSQHVFCNICKQNLETTKPETITETQPHKLNSDGNCADCGRFLVCLHPADRIEHNPVYELLQFLRFDNETHTWLINEYDVLHCLECGEYFDRVLTAENVELTDNHGYDLETDECSVCRAASPFLHCDHPDDMLTSRTVWDAERITYRSNNIHIVYGDKYEAIHCAACNKYVALSLMESDVYGQESHFFDPVTGYCIVCFMYCDHNEDYCENIIAYSNVYEQHDAFSHRLLKYVYDEVYCAICDKTIESVQSGPYFYGYEVHYYVDGVCESCGYVNTCDHPDEALCTEELWGDPIDYFFINPDIHATNAMHTFRTYCGLCNETISEDTAKSNYPEGHFYVNGECPCGNHNSCEHPEDMLAEDFVTEDGWFAAIDPSQHRFFCDLYRKIFCIECGEVLESYHEGDTSWTDNHCLINNVCRDCGYESACAHESRQFVDEWNAEPTYNAYCLNTHAIVATLKTEYWCEDCRSYLQTVSYTNVEYENHTFESDVCTGCGMEKGNCPHNENLREQREHIDREFSNYAPVDNLSHIVTGAYVADVVCLDCGETLETINIEDERTEQEPHSYGEDGICTLCGYEFVCQHPEERVVNLYYILPENAVYEQFNAMYHYATGAYVYDVYCKDCSRVLDTVVEEYEFTLEEEHNFDLYNVCELCGYENNCAHPEDSLIHDYWIDRSRCEQHDSEYHVIYGVRYDSITCGNCGTFVDEVIADENAFTISPHDFSDGDGICRYCGYTMPEPSTCSHPDEYINITYDQSRYLKFYAISGNDTMHNASYDGLTITSCNMCGETLSTESNGTVFFESEHSFDENGYCKFCCYTRGTVNACTHPEIFSDDVVYEIHNYFDYYYDNGTHNHSVQYANRNICVDCGAVTCVEVFNGVSLGEAHTYNADDICTICGHVYYNETPEPTMEPTMEPTVEPTMGPTGMTTPEPTPGPTFTPTLVPTPDPNCVHDYFSLGLSSSSGIKTLFSYDENQHDCVIDSYIDDNMICPNCGGMLPAGYIIDTTIEKGPHYMYGDRCYYCPYTTNPNPDTPSDVDIGVEGYSGISYRIYEVEHGGTATITWHSDDAAYYDIYFVCGGKSVETIENSTLTSYTMPYSVMEPDEICIFTIIPYSADGTSGNAEGIRLIYRTIAYATPEPTPGVTAEPTVEPTMGPTVAPTSGCPHPTEYITVIPESRSVYSLSADPLYTHIVYRYNCLVTRCATCYSELSRGAETYEGSFEEAHAFGSDGYCICGAAGENADPENCPHSPGTIVSEYDSRNVYSASADPLYTHVVTRYSFLVTKCTFCNTEISRGEEIPDGSYTESHIYGSDGKCICGALEADAPDVCAHPADCIVTEARSSYEYTLSADPANTHITKIFDYTVTRCTACWKDISTSAPTLADSYEEHHFYGSNGCCVCGVPDPSVTATPAPTPTATPEACQHPADQVRIDIVDYDCMLSCEYIDEYSHRSVYAIDHFYVCNACGECIDIVSTDDVRVVLEPHMAGSDNVCWDCDAKLPAPVITPAPTPTATTEPTPGPTGSCMHANTTVEPDFGDYVYGSIDEYNHGYTCTEYNNTYCTDCWELLYSEAVTTRTGTSYHFFRSGVCEDCGHVNTCEHPTDYYHWGSWMENTNTVSVNDAVHMTTGDLHRSYYCELCGEDLNYGELSVSGYTEYSPHYYDENGMCWECMHTNACSHPDYAIETEYVVEWENCECADEYSHINTGTEFRRETCNLCGMMVSETVENQNASVGELHKYDIHGTCWTCAYKSTCDHSAGNLTTREEFMFDVRYADNGAAGHTVTGRWYSITTCDDCFRDISRTLIDAEHPVAEAHSYFNGICSLCGHVNTCAHPAGSVVIEPTWINPCLESYTRTTCTYLSAGWYENTVCSDCGERLNCVLHPEDKLYTIDHDFDENGYCTRCTYNPNEGIGDPEE